METSAPRNGAHVIVVGLGLIGSALVALLARIAGLARVTLIDPDSYEPRNLATQDVTEIALTRNKAEFQAARLRRLNPRLEVRAIGEALEDVPLGRLKADVILGALDSRRARLNLEARARVLNVPYLDGGVLARERLVRVTAYLPGPSDPCFECGMAEADYDALEQTYPCERGRPVTGATGGSAALGAAAASLLALELEALLAGELGPGAAGRQVLLEARTHHHSTSRLPFNRRCLRTEHAPWSIEPLPSGAKRTSFGDLAVAGWAPEPDEDACIEIFGQRLVTRLRCEREGRERDVLLLERVARKRPPRCRSCGEPLSYLGFDLVERLHLGALGRRERGLRLASAGIEAGDVLSVIRRSGVTHLEVGPTTGTPPSQGGMP